MDNTSVLISQLIVMAIYLIVGFVFQYTGLIKSKQSGALSTLLLYAILPCVILKAFFQTSTPEKTRELLMSLIIGAVALVIAMLISGIVFRKDPIAEFSSTYSNAGFMGIPLITAVLGNEAVFYIAGMVALLNILQWTYGQSRIAGNWSECRPLAIAKNPLVISFGIGLIVYFTGLSLPSQLTTVVNSFAACNGPVAMVIIGISIGQMSLSHLKSPQVWLVCALRLIAIPVVTILVFSLFSNVPTAIRSAAAMAAVAPVGSNVIVYAQKQNREVGPATAMVCVSTVLSLFTIPLMMSLTNIW